MTTTDTPSTPPAATPAGRPDPASLRHGETQLLATFAATARRGPLRSARVSVSEGSTVLVAGVDVRRELFVEPHLLTGPIAADQAWAVMQDLFKLALVARTHPGSRAVLLLGGEPAAASARRFLTRAPAWPSSRSRSPRTGAPLTRDPRGPCTSLGGPQPVPTGSPRCLTA